MEREERKEKEKVARIEGILSAAKRVFSRKGYEAATMEDIASEAGFGKASLYFYFKGKEEVFLRLIKDGLEGQRRLLEQVMNSQVSGVEKLEAVLSKFFEHVGENRDFMRIVHSESQKLYATTLREVRSYIMKEHRKTTEGIASIVREGIKSGEFRKVEPTLAAASFMGIVRSVIFNWFVRYDKNILDTYKPMVMDIFLKGISK
ncbi:TetR family transcriptional regulator [bacterium]|nr:TetR family transcriptional regulator [bacterium]NIN91994.1 TetR family transcriptional regulator [bacterium]NIO18210.1 TetR family transcriptional regulator [bacterium]NIO73184.1 TetR family transcriptional regulator [bacterium]